MNNKTLSHKALLYTRRLFTNLFPKKRKPQILSYLITNQCNSHCITCSIWHEREVKEINLELLKKTLNTPIFSDIKHVGISGGEPSIFPDLKKHIDELIENLPSLQTLSITSNCIESGFWIQHLNSISTGCRNKGIYFQINISLDGIGKQHDKIRGTKGNFESFTQVLSLLKEKKIPYQIHSTINRHNLYHINAILHYAKSTQSDIIFRLASEISRLQNKEQLEKIALSPKQISFFCDFISGKAVRNITKSPGRRLYYKYLSRQLLLEHPRKAPCYFKKEGIVLSSDGNMFHCSRFGQPFAELGSNAENWPRIFNTPTLNETFNSDRCAACYHDQTGFWPIGTVVGELTGDKILPLKKIHWILKYLVSSAFLQIQPSRKNLPQKVESIAVIGMYGGEHVGDAAILGGVLLRIQKRYPGLKEVSVFSFRKDRTKCWVENLSNFPEITFELYDREKLFTEKLRHCQLLVWAGGPLMELPVVLCRNYYFMRKALSRGCKVELEGIGYGPINTGFGACLSKRILGSAHRVTVRSAKDREKVIPYCHTDDSVDCIDPAFDYLSAVSSGLNLSQEEKKEVENILSRTPEQRIIAINLRPLWDRYGQDSSFRFEKFLTEMALAVEELTKQGYLFIFFPMNADQFGFSDLETGYEIRDRLADPSFFRIWETEPTIQQLVYFMQHVDYSICMRFHAAIFSLSQGVKTIGLDYSLSGKGKVSHLFEHDERYCLHIKDIKHTNITNLIGGTQQWKTEMTMKSRMM